MDTLGRATCKVHSILTSQEGFKCTTDKEYLRAYCPKIYNVPCKDSGMPAFVGPFGLAGVLPGGPPVKINKCFYLTDFKNIFLILR